MRKLVIGSIIAAMFLGLVIGTATLPTSPIRQVEANAGTQWNAEYFDNEDLTGTKVTRIDDKIDFDWGTGSPDPAIGGDTFSARWTKSVNFPSSGSWTFHVEADDGLRMWIDVTQIVAKWDAGGYWTYDITLPTLTAGNHELKVEYRESSAIAKVKVWWEGGSGGGSGTSGTTCTVNWDASYFDNNSLSGSAKITRTDAKIDFNWGAGSPDGSVPADNFSARWTKTVNFDPGGQYRFRVGADDGVRMWIDVTQILDEWHGNPEGYRTYEVDVYSLTPGNHNLKVEYYEAGGNAGVQVCWEYIGVGTGGGGTGESAPAPAPTAIPPTVVYAAVVGNPVNVRIGPGQGNSVFTQIPYEKNYVVVAGVHDLSWVQIDLGDGTTGWVSNEWVWLYATPSIMNEDSTGGGQPDFVDTIPRVDVPIAPPSALPEDDPYRKILNGYTTDTVNFRDGPNLGGSRIIGSVPQGAAFQVEARNENGAWYLINYQGIRGWVSALYVVLTDGYVRDLVASSEVVPAPPFGQVFVPEDEQGDPAVTVRGQAKTNLKLREDPSILTGDQIGSVPQYAEFVIEVRNRSGAWYRITWEGQTGWVNAVYVTLIEGTVPDIPVQ